MVKIERHFFVCENQRPAAGKPSCGARGSDEILAALQKGLGAHPEVWGRVAITPTGCLGPCFEGPTIVVYPEGTWYVGVRREDVAEIVESHLVGGRAVERLVYRPED
jgi:(2Fe-2S) ferredoxin